MSMIIPPKAYAKLRASKEASEKLTTAVKRGRNPWNSDQEEQLSYIFQVIKETHDALIAIVDANG